MLRLLTAVANLDEPPSGEFGGRPFTGWFAEELDTVRRARLNITEQVWISDQNLSAAVDIAERVMGAADYARGAPQRAREAACPHTDEWFDRTICPEPCGSMHYYCTECGKRMDGCAHDRQEAEPR
jgi:hypothetical protein